MRRRLLAILAAVSLLLCMATAGAWARSYWFYDRWILRDMNDATIEIDKGQLRIQWYSDSKYVEWGWNFYGFEVGCGFMIDQGPMHVPQDPWVGPSVGSLFGSGPYLYFLLWLPTLLLALPPTGWVIASLRRRRKIREGCCPACGYDLRASKDACPECGRPIPPAPATPAEEGSR